jgi:hypothetical protein
MEERKMTNNLRKITSLLLSFVMVVALAMSAFAYDVSTDLVGTKFEEAGEVLGALKIMVGDPDGNFRPNDGIKRSEFSKIAVHALGLEESAQASSGTTQFKDVDAKYWANGYINVAAGQKIILGDPNGNFRPEDRISYQEAVTILVRMLGYEPAALAKGGYPQGYLMTATQYSLTKNAPGSGNEPAARGLAAILTYNALTIGMMEQTGFGVNTNYEITDKNILKTNLSTEKMTGQVTGNHFTKLTSASGLEKDEIEINGTLYKNEDTKAGNYLGYKTDYYVKTLDNGDEVVILVRPETGRNKTLDIDGENIATVDADKVNYWINKETDRDTKEAKVSTQTKMIFNGVAINYDESKIKENDTLSGNIKLLDINSDDVYDMIFVNEYKNLVVDTTSELSFTVSDKYGAPSLKFDEEDTTVKFSLQDKNGKEFKFLDLKEDMVISYLESEDKGVLKAVVLEEKANGTVKEIDDGKYKIGENFYRIADNYTDEIKLDDEGTFYLDIRGNIAGVDANSTLSDNYAYLIDAAEANGMSEYIDIKLFNMKGETVVLSSDTEIMLNGAPKEDAKVVLEALKANGVVKKQLFTYELNSDGKVNKLNTALNLSGYPLTIEKDKFVMNYQNTGVQYKSASSKLGSFNITDKTVVFDIPTTAVTDEDYAIKNKTMFENEGLYDVQVYDVGEDLSAKIVLVTNSTGLTNAESPIAVINRITQTRNEKGDSVEKLYAAQNGQMIAMDTTTTGILVNANGEALRQGDIIQYRTNGQGAIDKITVLFEVKNKATEFDTTNGDMQIVYGKVDRKFATSINLKVGTGAVENYSIEGAKVVSVDTTKSSNQVTLSNSGDIQRYDALSPRLVFLRIYKDEVKEVVIVR